MKRQLIRNYNWSLCVCMSYGETIRGKSKPTTKDKTCLAEGKPMNVFAINIPGNQCLWQSVASKHWPVLALGLSCTAGSTPEKRYLDEAP